MSSSHVKKKPVPVEVLENLKSQFSEKSEIERRLSRIDRRNYFNDYWGRYRDQRRGVLS